MVRDARFIHLDELDEAEAALGLDPYIASAEEGAMWEADTSAGTGPPAPPDTQPHKPHWTRPRPQRRGTRTNKKRLWRSAQHEPLVSGRLGKAFFEAPKQQRLPWARPRGGPRRGQRLSGQRWPKATQRRPGSGQWQWQWGGGRFEQLF